MSEDVPESEYPFDLERLRELIDLMEQHSLTEICLERGKEKWKICRGSQQEFVQVPAPMQAAPVSTPAAEPQEVADNTLPIKSPTVGTFYAAPSPDDPSFVTVGTKVQPDTIVCIVEAMKVFNQIPAEVGGIIEEILVNNGDPVEFGQPLFRVRPG